MLAGLVNWLIIVVLAGVGIAGLFIASENTHDAVLIGGIVSAVSLVAIAVLVRRNLDKEPA